MGQTTRDSAQGLQDQLGRLEAPVLGVVANGIKLRRGGKYGYGYYGGYGSPAEQPAEKPVTPEVPANPE
jgi:Mrp family chromosome partitioning ATPase